MVPELSGRSSEQEAHRYLYWENAGRSGMQAVRSSGQTEVNELPTNHLVFIEEGFGPLSAGLTELGSERGVFDQSLQRGGQGGCFAGRHE